MLNFKDLDHVRIYSKFANPSALESAPTVLVPWEDVYKLLLPGRVDQLWVQSFTRKGMKKK